MANSVLYQIKQKTRIRTRFLNIIQTFSRKVKASNGYLKLVSWYTNNFGFLHKKRILFIVGVQRSGTSAMFLNLLKDTRVKAYNEFSELSEFGDEKLRLNPMKLLKKQIRRNIKPLIVLKPLVESQNIQSILKSFPNGRAVWIYRHYRDVANSNLNKFGTNNGIKNLTPLVNKDYKNWRADGVPNHIREIVLKYYSEDMLPHDAAALFWFVRNSFYFNLKMHEDSRILLMRYRDFAEQPGKEFGKIYKHLNLPPSELISNNDINPNSLNKGKQIELSPEIESLCEELFNKLEDMYKKLSA